MLLLISYDIDGPGRPPRREAVAQAIANGARDFRQAHYTAWIVDTDEQVTHWRERLQPFMDEEDNLLIARLGHDYAGYLVTDLWTWMRDRL